MAQTSINIRMDADLKKQFETFCGNVGMTMTTAFNIFAKAAVREQKIPFEISARQGAAFTPAHLDAHLRKGYEQSVAEEGEPYGQVLDRLEKRYQ